MNSERYEAKSTSLITIMLVAITSSLAAVAVVICVILPAAYGIDPTGLGGRFGLMNPQSNQLAMADKSAQVSQKPAQDKSPARSQAIKTDIDSGLEPEREDTFVLTIPPKQALSYRVAMTRDYALKYTWKTDGKPLNLKFIGEKPSTSEMKLFSHFSKDNIPRGGGLFIVPFDGTFAWHWENNSDQPVTVWLNAKGAYRTLGSDSTDVSRAIPLS